MHVFPDDDDDAAAASPQHHLTIPLNEIEAASLIHQAYGLTTEIHNNLKRIFLYLSHLDLPLFIWIPFLIVAILPVYLT